MKSHIALSLILLGLTLTTPFFVANADSTAIDVMTQAQKASNQQASFRIQTTNTEASGRSSVIILEHVKPDRYHFSNLGSGEIIVIGKDSYMRQGKGAWQKSKMDMSSFVIGASGGGLNKEVFAYTTLTKIGPSSLNGTSMMVYAMTYNKNKVTSQGKLWIGTADNLPYQADSTVELPVTKVGNKSFGGKSHSVTVYEYNLKIEIKAPL